MRKAIIAIMLCVTLGSVWVVMSSQFSGCTAVIEGALIAYAFVCGLDIWCLPDSVDLGGPDPGAGDLDPDTPPGTWLDEDPCSGAKSLRVWTKGIVNQPVTVWVALEQNANVVSYSSGLNVDPGKFAGYYLYIPLDGIQLNDATYSLSFYASIERSEVGDPTTAVSRNQDAFQFTVSERIRGSINEGEKGANPMALNDSTVPPCLLVLDSLDLTVKILGDTAGVEIIRGHNNVNDLEWWVSGESSSSGSVTNNGRFYALGLAQGYGDLWVCVRELTHQVSDSVNVVIEEATTDGCSSLDYKYAGVWYETGDDYVGASCLLKARYGELCDGTDTSVQAHSAAYVAVVKDPSSPTRKWAQCGFTRL